MATLLEIKGLRLEIGGAEILRGVDLRMEAGSCLGLAGESGSGKTMTALALMGLLPAGARVSAGSLRFGGEELLGLPGDAWRRLRGGRIAMVFQEPFNCLNPVRRIDEQVAEAAHLHRGLSGAGAMAEARRSLERVGIEDPGSRGRQFPHQWSGGMRQRAMIAMALAGGPSLLVADEPTTALDVTVQSQILALLRDLHRRDGLSLLLISHDLGVIHGLAGAVAVMRAGEVVEAGPCDEVYAAPRHDYTRQLFRSYRAWAGAA